MAKEPEAPIGLARRMAAQALDAPYLMRPGILAEIGTLLAERGVMSAVIVTNETVGPLYGRRVADHLGRAGLMHDVITLKDGEKHKTLETVKQAYDLFIEAGLERDGAVVALGGGVIGDLAGFAAATYLRGVHLVQAPTSVLAMVDASIGGKVGVNLPRGKNLVGAFKAPLFIAADPDVLRTLPAGEYENGFAEIVKAALIGDLELFLALEDVGKALTPEQIMRAATVKRLIVAEDPYERGRRLHLNLGHTFGHALEQLSGYKLAHGRAVAVGLVLATRLAARLKLCGADLVERVTAVLRKVNLPVDAAYDPGAVVSAMQTDKKKLAGRLRFILPCEIGRVTVSDDVPLDVLMAVLKEVRA